MLPQKLVYTPFCLADRGIWHITLNLHVVKDILCLTMHLHRSPAFESVLANCTIKIVRSHTHTGISVPSFFLGRLQHHVPVFYWLGENKHERPFLKDDERTVEHIGDE